MVWTAGPRVGVVEAAVGEPIVVTSGGIEKRTTGVLGLHEVLLEVGQVRAANPVATRVLRRFRFGRLRVRGGADGMLVRMQSSINGTTAGLGVLRRATSALP
jgi:hypothetical protein